MISNFLIDFYSEKVGEQLSQDKFNNIINTYGDDYDSLINDLYSKYDPGNINDDKLNIIKDTYGLIKKEPTKEEEQKIEFDEDYDYSDLKEAKAKRFDKGIFKMAEREAFDKYKETGEIELSLLPKEEILEKRKYDYTKEVGGEYLIDGEKVSRLELKNNLYNSDFVDKLQEGKVNVDIKNDERLEDLAKKQLESGSQWGDKGEAILAAFAQLASGAVDAQTFVDDTIEEITGAERFTEKYIGGAPKEVRDLLSEKLVDKVDDLNEKQRAYEYNFSESILNGNFANAANIGFNTVAGSAPIMIAAGLTGGAGGVAGALTSAATMSGILIPAEYAATRFSEDEKLKELSKGEQLTRAFFRGGAEGFFEGIMGPVGAKSFGLFKDGLKATVKRAAAQGGKEAAETVAKEMSDKTALEIFKAFGIDATKEGGTEALTSLSQDLTDDLLGVQDLSIIDYLKNAGEAGALGIFMGGTVQSIGATGKVLLRNNKVKQGAISEIRKEQELGNISKKQGDELIRKVEDFQQAVKQTDSELSEEKQEEIANLIYEKTNLKQKIEGLDPNQESVKKSKERIQEIDNLISKTSASETEIKLAEEQVSIAKEIKDLRINKTVKFAETQGKKLGKKVYVVETDSEGSAGDKAQKIYDEFLKENPDQSSQDVSSADGFYLGDAIVINKDVVGKTGAFNTGQHEVLHGVINNAFNDLNTNQKKKLISDFRNILSDEQNQAINNRFKAYESDPNFDAETSVEIFTVLSDAIAKKEVTFNESFGNKLKNLLQEIFRKIGIVKDFSNARQAYNFLKDYNKTAEKGLISARALKLAEVAPVKQEISMSKTASENVQKIYEEQGVGGALDIIEEFKPIVNKIVQRRSEAPNFDRQLLTDEIETGKRGLLELIQDYNIESGVPLAAYINKFLPARAIEASRRVLGESFTEDVSERVDIAAPEVEVEIKTKEEKVPRSLRKKLNIEKGSDLYNKVKDAVVKTFGTKLPEVTDPKFKKALSDSYKRELKKEVNALMGTRSDFKMFLTNNAETLYKSIPQETINKRFQDFSEPVLDKEGKQVREKTAIGKGVFKKKPFNKEEFINYFLGEDVGASTKGTRKTALSETIADEMALDATMEVIEDPKVFEKFKEIQEIEGKKVPKDIKPKISEKVKRPEGFNFSKSVYEIINIRNLFQLETNGKDKLLKAYGLNESLKIKNEKDIDAYIDMLKTDIFKLGPKEMWFGPSGGSVFTSSSKIIGVKSSSDPLWKTFISRIKELESDNTIKYGKPIPGVNTKNIWSLRNKYDKLFKSPETIEKNIKNGEIKKFNKQVAAIHKTLWERINKEISKDKNKATGIATYLGIVANDTGHWHKLGAQFEGYSKDITGKRYEYEHAMPATAAYLYLLDAALSDVNFNTAYDLVVDNYKLIALDKAMDDKLRNARTAKGYSLQRRMPDDWSVIDNFWWQRYFNDIVSSQDGGIDPNSIIGLEGKTFGEMFNVDASGNSTTVEVEKLKSKAKSINVKNLSNNVVNFSKTTSNEGVIGYAKTVDEALKVARDPNAPVKKIRVFDFDDTLATTKSDVLFTAPDGTEGKLNAEEFAKRGKELLDEGYVFDFSEFNKVTKGKPGPLLEVAKKIQAARGTEDVFVLTARAPEAQVAIKEFLDGVGLNIPLENITGLGNSTGEAKANWMIDKAAEGYNDFYFADDAYQNVKAVRDAMSVLDVKSKVQQAKINFSKSVNEDFNKIIEQTTGIASEKVYSEAKAKVRGANKGNKKFFIPYSAEDFMGLIYPLLSKGKLGDSQMAWFKKNLLDPYARAQENLSTDRLQLMEDFKTLKKALEVPKDLRKKTDSGFTKEQAVRVYLFNKAGFDVPGISKTDLNELLDLVNSDGVLKAFGDQIFNITKGDGYAKPGESWLVGTITTDLIDVLNTVKRAKYLEQSGYTANAELIFSKENLNKLEAAYGTKYREAMENILGRMKSGKNRIFSGNRLSNRVLDYINNSTGAIMFFNTRSAVLQTISAINFLNWSFNNPIKAGAAFANQPQYWKDFVELINSDYLVDRRNGLKLNINESEIADAAATSKNKAKAAINYILQKGFLPTQYADSFAIASGGATFYRNRINDLVKNQGMSEADAKKQAMLEWRETAEISQQSSDPSKISAQQASDLGRVILAFANTPMQYARIQKRALQDLVKGRGDAKTHVSKIIYYAVVQNLIFNALQSALFGLGFGDDEDDEKKEKMYLRTANGMLDSQLRGLGLAGATVAVIKNFLTDIYERSGRSRPEYVDSIYKLLQISPPISSKISKIRGAAWQFDSKKRRQEIFEKGFSIDNPAYEASAKVISATANIPLDRVYSKVDNISGAMSEDAETWQTIAMLAGWPKWQIMPDSKESSSFNKGSVKISSKKEQGYETLKKLNKSEQEVMLKKLKYSEYEIKRMKKEDQRIKAIMKRNK